MCNPSHQRALLNVMISMSGTFYGMKILSHQWQLDHQLRKTDGRRLKLDYGQHAILTHLAE